MNILGINAIFHDSSAAIVVDGSIVAAAEEERFNRRKHGKDCVPFNAWEPPVFSASWCLQEANLTPGDIDIVAFSYDPALVPSVTDDHWEPIRTLYAEHMPSFLNDVMPGIKNARMQFVRHHIAHAASAYLAAPFSSCAVLVLDGRGENTSSLAGVARNQRLEILAAQELPHSLGLFYEELTMHLGFRRSSDEYKVMGMAAHGTPRYLARFRELIRIQNGYFTIEPIDWASFAPARHGEWSAIDSLHADLAASAQARVEEVLLELGAWLYEQTGEEYLAMAGGIALNCVANARLAREGPFRKIWVQPASGDAGTALGAALYAAQEAGDKPKPMSTAALGRSWDEHNIEQTLRAAQIPYERPVDIAESVADILAANGVVGWVQGRSEFGPRALGHRSLLANPQFADNLERLNDIKGREQFRPLAPMVLEERAGEIFDGQLPSQYMVFTHRVQGNWSEKIPAAVHIDNTARIQTVNRESEPLVAHMLDLFAERTGIPVVLNTSFNTAGRPMVDAPRDALECFSSAAIDALAIGPFLIRRKNIFKGAAL